MNSQLNQIQKIVFNYFKEVDDKTIMDITNSFTFVNPTDNKKASDLIMQFLKDNGLEKAFVNYMSDYQNPQKLWLTSSPTESHMIEQIKTAFLVLCFNRNYRNNKVDKSEETKLKRNFKFVKNKCLEILNCLNNNENYIYGKDEDKKLVEKITKMN